MTMKTDMSDLPSGPLAHDGSDPGLAVLVERDADTVPGQVHRLMRDQLKVLTEQYEKDTRDMALMHEELLAHREAIKDKGLTRIFDVLMQQAHAAGARALAFEVKLDDYFPYPSPKQSWTCVATAGDDALGPSGGIAHATGRSGEEALREIVKQLAPSPVERVPSPAPESPKGTPE